MLKREKCNLRDICEDDLDIILSWRNSELIRKNMFSEHLISIEEHKKWFQKIASDKSTVCKVFEYENKPLGVVNFTDFDIKNQRCSWGFYIGSLTAPKQSGRAMGYLALQYIFEAGNVHKLCAEVFRFNTKSIRYHKMLGFNEEGCLSRHVYKNGIYQDVFLFAHFREHWMDIKDDLMPNCFI